MVLQAMAGRESEGEHPPFEIAFNPGFPLLAGFSQSPDFARS